MLTCCNTARGRLACGLGGVLIAALALACLWAFSPAVTAGDDPPAKSGSKGGKCPEPVPPPLSIDVSSSPVPPLATVPPPPPVADTKAVAPIPPVGSPPPPEVGPATGTVKPAPLPPVGAAPPPPPVPILPAGGVIPAPAVTPPKAESDAQDIKQLVAHLSEIRTDRAKLDEKERQTIQTIKQKYQEQKQALEQLDRELRKLGINCDDKPAATEKTAAPPTTTEERYSVPLRRR
ncbi:MAG TPA: hypothetical protein VFW33_00855 [Gemmataceae bacterium]|nr:hypothetical protein [Gemmataceae bacterium]